jgi:hypothetical protein
MANVDSEVIADFVGKKAADKKKPVIVFDDADYSMPGLTVYWVEKIAGSIRLMKARIIAPANIKIAPRDVPGSTRDYIFAESAPDIASCIEAAGKVPDDYIAWMTPEKKAGYIYFTSKNDITIAVLDEYLRGKITSLRGETKRATTTTK